MTLFVCYYYCTIAREEQGGYSQFTRLSRIVTLNVDYQIRSALVRAVRRIGTRYSTRDARR